MKTAAKLLFILSLITSVNLQSQTLINALSINSVSLELNGVKSTDAIETGKMILPNTETTVLLYQNKTLTYWAVFDLKQCGKKATLSWNTFLELNDGRIIEGNHEKLKGKAVEDQSGWIIGNNQDVFETSNDDENKVIASFNFEMRFKN